jgi:hypothetical protein
MKSKALLDSFVHFCEVNPHLRFWQALSVWAGQSIYGTHNGACIDTFYWDGQFGAESFAPPIPIAKRSQAR